MAKLDWSVVDGRISNVMRGAALGKAAKPYVISFDYSVDGLYYGGEFKTFAGQWYTEGDTIAVRYNPAVPGETDMGGSRQWNVWFHTTYCAVGVLSLLYVFLRGCR